PGGKDTMSLPVPTVPATLPEPAPGAQTSGPRELPPGSWAAPPVRRGEGAAPPTAVTETPASPPTETHVTEAPHRPTRWPMILVGLFVMGVVVVLGLGGLLAWYWVATREDRGYEEARKMYGNEQYSNAAAKYKELAEKFPESSRLSEYRFMQEFCDLRAA